MSETYELKEKVVVYHAGWVSGPSIGEVTRITPSGRIYVHVDNYYKDEIIFNPDGYERGASGYSRTKVAKGTQELFNQIHKRKLIEEFQSFFRTNGENKCSAHNLSLEALTKMWELAKPTQTA